MKMYKIIYLLIAIVTFASCEKKDLVENPVYKGPIKVNFNNYGGTQLLDLPPFATTPTIIPIEVKLTNTVDPAPTDIRVKVLLDRNVLYDYNVDNGTNYTVPPDSAFTFTPTKEIWVTIPKGQRKAGFSVSIVSARLNLSSEYAIAFSIGEAIGAEINSVDVEAKYVVAFNLRNQYDGVYQFKGRLWHPTNAVLRGSFAFPTWELRTSGASSLDSYIPGSYLASGVGVPAHPVFNNGAPSFFTGVNPRINIGAGNVVTLSSSTGTGVQFIPARPFENFRYIPATKTFIFTAKWNGDGTTTFDSLNLTRIATDTLVYLRPR